ncbi:MAG: MtrB/PioB family decaheme-associated outer membrane protein [Zoogloeaceae bacterium]|jgi:MtrB/PioB family decaheme-associated outer membrane protein|nr:MtrB/PioB family decaheme-associated outer membrane protein [Zoogloeaceae bacterium]
MITQKQFRLSAVAAALTAVFGPALADDEVTELIEPDSAISIGFGNWSNDRRQTGMYDGMREGKSYILLDADIVKRDNDTGTWYKLDARDLGLDNRSIKGEVLKQGDIGISMEYNRIRRDDPNEYRTNVQGIGSSSMTTVGAVPIYSKDLSIRREQLNFDFYKNLYQNGKSGLDFNLTYRNEDKTGARNFADNGHTNFAPEPIDSTTRQIEAALSWSTEKFQLRGGYNASWYENNIRLAGAGTAFQGPANIMSLPLDNQAHQLFLNGGYNFTKSTRGTFKVEYAHATQNENFAFPGVGGVNSLDGEVVTKLVQLGLTSRITKDFSLNANLRYHDKDDRTPNNVSFAGAAPDTHPHFSQSLRTLSGKVEGVYRFADVYSLVGSVEEKRQKRELPENINGTDRLARVPFVHKLNETTGRLELRRSLTDTLNGSVSWVHADRDGSSYGPTDPNPVRNQLNPLNVADRKRDKARLSLDWTPLEALSLQFVFEDGKDKYSGQNPLGLDEGKTRLYSLDATWTVNDKLSFNAWYSYDQTKAKQTGRMGTTLTQTRRYDIEDNADSLGLGVKWEATSALHTGANLEWTRSVSEYDIAAWSDATGLPVPNGIAATRVAPSDITDKHLRVSLFALYALNKTSDLRFDLIYDRWKTNDWTWKNSNGSPLYISNGTYVIADPSEAATFVGFRYIYKFQ